MANFGPKSWTNPFGQRSVFRHFKLFVFIAQNVVFLFQNIIKHNFLFYIAQKNVGKMATFGPKPWTNPFGKRSIFRLFKLLVFIAQNVIFFRSRISQNTIFCSILSPPKKLEKRPILAQNHGLTPLEKGQFFDFLNFFFLQPRTFFFSFQNIIKHSFMFYIAQTKSRKNSQFWTKTMD